MRSKISIIIPTVFLFLSIFFLKEALAYPYCSNNICVTGYVAAQCVNGCAPACEVDCWVSGSCGLNTVICGSGSSRYLYSNCCYSAGYYTYGGSCDEDCDCTNSCQPVCGTCTPTCPIGSATSPTNAYPVTARCSNGSGCPDSTRTCYYQRQDLCTNSTISSQWIKSGQSSVITSNANTNVNSFTYVFYNRDRLDSGGIPQPICRTYDATWAPSQGVCPAGSYQMVATHTYSTARISDTLTIPANSVFVRDITNGNLYVDNIQINTYFTISGRPISLPDGSCVVYLNHCTPLCSPVCGPTYADSAQYTSSGLYLGSLSLSCSNTPAACGTESRSCYCYDCIQSCPAPLSNTSLSLPPLPNLVLDNFRICTTGCAVARAEDCYEPPSDQPEESIAIDTNPLNEYDFLSLTHSGIPSPAAGDLNDPVTMTATYYDPNDASEIEGMFVWFRDDTTAGEVGTPLLLSTTATPRAPSTASWGFMMKKEGSTWYPYVPSYAVSPAVWRRAIYDPVTGRFVISGTAGGNMVGVTVRQSDIVTNTVSKTVSMTFRLKFSNDSTVTITQAVSQIKYKVFLMGLDTFSFTPNDNYESFAAIRDRIDFFWSPNQLRYRASPTPSQLYARAWVNPNNPATGTNTTWTIDKANPSISFTGGTPTASGNSINISWSASDAMNLYSIVGNIYTTAGADAREITLSTSTPGVVLKSPNAFTPLAESSENTGRLNGDWSFRVAPNMTTTANAGTVSIDIGANRTGTLIFYLTVFDDAGNMAIAPESYNLNDWFVTDGGLAYSADGTSFVRNSPETSWVGNLPPFTPPSTESLTYLKGDLSSEMWAEDTLGTPTALDNITASVKSYSIKNHEGHSLTNYYETLYKSYEFKQTFIPSPVYKSFANNYTITDAQIKTPLCDDSSSYCILDFQQNLTINPGLMCNSRVLIFVRGNLTLSPPLRNVLPPASSNRDGCIFVVGGDLNILEGTGMSGATMVYDQIHGYFVVDGEVRINSEAAADGEGGTKLPSAIYDGVYINGGIQSLQGVYIGRYLRLVDRQTYPVVAIDHHSKYGVLGGVFFGSNFTLQKVEPGFKP